MSGERRELGRISTLLFYDVMSFRDRQEVTHGVPAIREKGELLIHLETLRCEDLKKPAFRFLVRSVLV